MIKMIYTLFGCLKETKTVLNQSALLFDDFIHAFDIRNANLNYLLNYQINFGQQEK